MAGMRTGSYNAMSGGTGRGRLVMANLIPLTGDYTVSGQPARDLRCGDASNGPFHEVIRRGIAAARRRNKYY